jgi:GT2 family glycosyltransferase
VRAAFPAADVVELPDNLGVAARNTGVARAKTRYVAFSDDDSWWAPGALSLASDILDSAPRLGLLAAQILVSSEQSIDPVCQVMAQSPLPCDAELPGRPVLGFVACGAVVRRSAFLRAGGFVELLFLFGEEEVLALDLAQEGWSAAYVEDVIAHHHPSERRDGTRRRELETRNAVLSAWLRRPVRVALARSARAVAASRSDTACRRGLGQALRLLPAALARRRLLDPELERRLRQLEQTRTGADCP